MTTYSLANCEAEKYSCKANSGTTGCENKVCADYSKVEGVSSGTAVSTDDHCKALNPDCTIDNGSPGKVCMTRPATCTGTVQTACSFST